MSTRAWAFSIPWLLSSETPIFTIASGRSRWNLRAPRLHGRPQRRELAHATSSALENGVDLRALVLGQIELGARVVGVDLRRRTRPDERGAVGRIPEHPGERDLAQRYAARLGDLASEPLDHGDVGLEIVAAEDRLAEGHTAAPPVARGLAEIGGGREGAGEQAVTERAVAHDANALGETRRKRLSLLAPVEHVVAHLRDVDAPRAHALGHHRAGEVRHADEAH